MRSWRTTVGGIVSIVGSLAAFAGPWIASGVVPSETAWTLMFTGLNAGVIALLSADQKVVKEIQEDAK